MVLHTAIGIILCMLPAKGATIHRCIISRMPTICVSYRQCLYRYLRYFPLAAKTHAVQIHNAHHFRQSKSCLSVPLSLIWSLQSLFRQRCQGPVKQADKMADGKINRADISPAPAKFRSKVWTHFGFKKQDGKTLDDVSVCRICLLEMAYSGNTTNMAVQSTPGIVCLNLW